MLRALAFVALAALAFAPLERLVPARPARRHRAAADLAFAVAGQLLVALGIAFPVGWALASLEPMALDPPLLSTVPAGGGRTLAEVAVGLVVFDLAGYGYHRLAHRLPWLWRLHEIHHSSEALDWLAAFRQHPLEILLQTFVENAPLVLLGVPLGAHATVLAVLRLNTVFVHANIRVPVGPWSAILATPRFHHRHHQRAGRACNFAALFPLLDRMFGTWSGDDAAAVGLERRIDGGFLALCTRPLRGRAADR